MRLLVFGGTAYTERRRIGSWSPHLNTEILQDRTGLSEKSPAFGVGFDNGAPYLIFRKIVPAGDRTYPISVLIEPPPETWEQFEWNGALLIHALFGSPESDGNELLKYPESFHSEDSLNRIFSDLSVPALSELSSIDNKTAGFIRDFWFGVLKIGSAIALNGVEGRLETRPLPGEMARFLQEHIPESLRYCTGWLVGGNREHVSPFGVGFVFDGQKRTVSAAENQAIEKVLEDGRRIRPVFEYVERICLDGNPDSLLAEYFSHLAAPEMYSNKQLIKQNLSDIQLIEYLFRRLSPDERIENKIIQDDTEEKIFERLNDERISFYVELREYLGRLIVATQSANTPRIKFLALHAFDSEIYYKVLFSTSHELEIVKLRLDNGKNTPLTILPEIRELCHKKNLVPTADEWNEFARKIAYSTNNSPSFSDWQDLINSPDLNEFESLRNALSEATRTISIDGMQSADPNDVNKRNYLIYGNDAGGETLASLSPLNINALVEFCLANHNQEPQLSDKSIKWLSALIYSRAFENVTLDKLRIAALLDSYGNNSWAVYSLLHNAFNGRPADSLITLDLNPNNHERLEEKNLLFELHRWLDADPLGHDHAPPALRTLCKLFTPINYTEIVKLFFNGEPGFDDEQRYVNWLEGWVLLSGYDATSEMAKEKIHSECLRSSAFNHRTSQTCFELLKTHWGLLMQVYSDHLDNWSSFGASLLCAGTRSEDEQRLNYFQSIFGNNKLKLSSQFLVFILTSDRNSFLRRLYKTQGKSVLKYLKDNLGKDSKEKLESLLTEYERELIATYKERILELNNLASRSDAEIAFQALKKECLQEHSERIFELAFKESIQRREGREKSHILMLYAKSVKNRELDEELAHDIKQGQYQNIDNFLFSETGEEFRKEFESNIKKDKETFGKYVEKSVASFLNVARNNDREFHEKSGVFFDRFILLERMPKLDRNGQARISRGKEKTGDPNIFKIRETTVDHVFECLPDELARQFLAVFCETPDISTLLQEVVFYEFIKCERIFQKVKKVREQEKDSQAEAGYTSFQISVLKLLLSMGEKNKQPLAEGLAKLKRDFINNKSFGQWSDVEKTIKHWNISELSKKKTIYHRAGQDEQEPVHQNPGEFWSSFREALKKFSGSS